MEIRSEVKMKNLDEINKIVENHEKRITIMESIINEPKLKKQIKEKKNFNKSHFGFER